MRSQSVPMGTKTCYTGSLRVQSNIFTSFDSLSINSVMYLNIQTEENEKKVSPLKAALKQNMTEKYAAKAPPKEEEKSTESKEAPEPKKVANVTIVEIYYFYQLKFNSYKNFRRPQRWKLTDLPLSASHSPAIFYCHDFTLDSKLLDY